MSVKTPVINPNDSMKSFQNIRNHFKEIDNNGGVVTANDLQKALAELEARLKK